MTNAATAVATPGPEEDPSGASNGPESGQVPRDRKQPAKQTPGRPRGRPRKKPGRGKGGGPKTEEGKARAALNALKFGIHAMHPVVIADFEDPDEWDDFYDGFREYLKPEGPPEEDLVYQIAANRWRARRVIHAEAAEISKQVWMTERELSLISAYENSVLHTYPEGIPDRPDPDEVIYRQQERIIPFAAKAELIVRYESHLNRAWRQLCLQLDILQARRLGRPATVVQFQHSSAPVQIGPAQEPAPSEAGEHP